MKNKIKSLSQTLIDSAKELGLPKTTIAQLKKLNIPEVRYFTANEVKKIRTNIKVSQGVFAAILNVNPSTVQKWEQGSVKPRSSTLRLLSIIEAKGIDVIS